jgi:hypothetical protein
MSLKSDAPVTADSGLDAEVLYAARRIVRDVVDHATLRALDALYGASRWLEQAAYTMRDRLDGIARGVRLEPFDCQICGRVVMMHLVQGTFWRGICQGCGSHVGKHR